MASTIPVPAPSTFRGNDKLLLGIVLGVVTFWLFAGTTGTIAPNILADINGAYTDPVHKTWADPLIDVAAMNLAVSITALFPGMFIVVAGGLADRIGRVRISLIGNGMGILGSLMIVLATGPFALPLMLGGRAIQGLSAACIMPTTMALVKTYWDGPGRQRAVSMWSIGSWGGSGLASIFGGYVATFVGWRWDLHRLHRHLDHCDPTHAGHAREQSRPDQHSQVRPRRGPGLHGLDACTHDRADLRVGHRMADTHHHRAVRPRSRWPVLPRADRTPGGQAFHQLRPVPRTAPSPARRSRTSSSTARSACSS